MRLVLFDIDGTLIPKPGSEPRFAGWLFRHGRLGLRQQLAYLGFLLRYLPRYRGHVLQKNKAYLSGLRRADVVDWAASFVREELVPVLHPPTLTRLRKHCEAGDHVVLLSGTPDFIAVALARELGTAGGYGALCATRVGRFTARPPLCHPYGRTKVSAAREIAGDAGLPLAQAIAYGDSINDAWLFRAVGESVVVMPDRRLRLLAGAEGWHTLAG